MCLKNTHLIHDNWVGGNNNNSAIFFYLVQSTLEAFTQSLFFACCILREGVRKQPDFFSSTFTARGQIVVLTQKSKEKKVFLTPCLIIASEEKSGLLIIAKENEKYAFRVCQK